MSGPTAVVDTSIIVGSLSPSEPTHADCNRVLRLAHEGRFRAILSAVTVAEVCVGYFQQEDESGRVEFLDHVRGGGSYEVLALDLEQAVTTARVRAQTGLRLPDAAIVATAIHSGSSLVITHDDRFDKARRIMESVTARAFIKMREI
jgi:predicted nucleic acid-binding protein